ncbi:MAG TPA: DUF3500 domain-containing protein [Planctomycetota bacterium]|nr:DUF3500 domain-containing protein [Planctomycetota bacterium]
MTPRAPRSRPQDARSDAGLPVSRRGFLRAAGAGATALAMPGVSGLFAQESRPADRTAEDLIRDLYSGLREDQRKAVVLPIDAPERLKYFNAALGKKIGEVYTKPQQDQLGRILRALSSGEDGWRQISRDGTWDESKAFENCGANLFGDLSGKYTWVFSGHHLTMRCDGDTEEGVAFGGPLYYGHSPSGYSDRNLFHYQTKSALAVYESLTKEQREQAVAYEDPAEGLDSVKFRCTCDSMPGVPFPQLSKESQALVDTVLRNLLSPFRKSDADEVLQVVRKTGGMEAMHLMFYRDREAQASQPWSFWRLEGPGFVWNFRVLPHVHTYVNISSKV